MNTSTPFVVFLLLYLPLFSIEIGCSKGSAQNQPCLTASPAVLDFGKVRPTDSPVKLTFNVCNNSNQSVAITDILSGCGCTIIDIPKEPIPPKGKVAIPLSVNVWGRSGTFENDLIIKTTTDIDVQVPIHGTIESDIWTMGQSLRCTFDPQEQRASTILTVYTTKYPNIVFVDTPQEDVLLKEISRETQQGETAIRFSVDVTIEPNSAMMRTINIVPADTTIAPLAIPLYCHREK